MKGVRDAAQKARCPTTGLGVSGGSQAQPRAAPLLCSPPAWLGTRVSGLIPWILLTALNSPS